MSPRLRGLAFRDEDEVEIADLADRALQLSSAAPGYEDLHDGPAVAQSDAGADDARQRVKLLAVAIELPDELRGIDHWSDRRESKREAAARDVEIVPRS